MSHVVAIVGRPNVGKSALFNRIVGKRIAIVHDEPGVTRDRISAEAEWQGRPFTLVDTGGIGLLRGEKARDVIEEATVQQVMLAIESAELILFIVNAQEGVHPLDSEVAERLRVCGKTVLTVANKTDNDTVEAGAWDFESLGFARVLPVSAIHDRGIESLMKQIVRLLPPRGPEVQAAPALKLAIIGRPNVGKSSIINALTQSERVIVSPIPGTTRDSVDVPFEVENHGVREHYVLIDTAGIRKRGRIETSVEFYSLSRTEASIVRSDLVIFVLDATAGITAYDKKVGALITGNNKACVVVVNKWDIVQEQLDAVKEGSKEGVKRQKGAEKMRSLSEFAEWVQEKLFFIDYAPVIFTSAKSGFHLDRLLEAVRFVAGQLNQSVPTALLNRILNDAIERRQPVSAAGHRLKFFYATQIQKGPPVFLLFVNRKDLFSDNYAKYLQTELRKAFGFEGCPIQLDAKPRPKTIEPKRKPRVEASKGTHRGKAGRRRVRAGGGRRRAR